MSRLFSIMTISALAFISAAHARDDSIEDAALALDDAWQCAQEAPLTPALRKALAQGELFLVRRSAREMIAIAKLPGVGHGTMLLRRDGARWSAFYLAQGSEVSAIRARAGDDGVNIISFWVRESGGALHAARYDWATRTIACSDLAMPDDLNQPSFNGEFATFEAIAIDANGAGRIVTEAQIDRENDNATRYYAYATNDAGRTWSGPQRITNSAIGAPNLQRVATTRVSAALRTEIAK
jgi:hypothetical protein